MKTYGCGCSRCKDARKLFQRVVSQDVKLSLDNPSGHVPDNVQDAPKGREGKPQVRYLAKPPKDPVRKATRERVRKFLKDERTVL